MRLKKATWIQLQLRALETMNRIRISQRPTYRREKRRSFFSWANESRKEER